MLIAGLGFKASAAPFHQWTPDVYEGAPTPVTAFMAAATKTVAVVLTMRVLVTAFPEESELWTIAIAVIVCASLAVGNLAALVQRNVKRMLAYSSVAHAGFLLIAVAANNELGGRALLYYLIPYCAASIGAFGVVAARERELGVAGHARQPRRASAGSGRCSASRCGPSCSRSPGCRRPAASSASSTSSRRPTTAAGRGS